MNHRSRIRIRGPVCLLPNRDFVPFAIDPFAPELPNWNGLVIGESDAGKSFTLCQLMLQFSTQSPLPKIVFVDNGRSSENLNHHWYPIWAFAILTGMRSGELHDLTWDQIDLDKNLLLVDRSYDSNVKIVGPTKERYWRTVPLNSSLRNLILDLKQNLNLVNSGFVLPRRKD